MRPIDPPDGACGARVVRLADVRYELLRRIGGGAFGEVYVARSIGCGFERRVCIKRLARSLDPAHADALREEARVLSSVCHANVVSVLGLGEEAGGGPFLVLELVDGLDLRALCKSLEPQSRLPDMVGVYVACALLRGLAAVQRSLPGLVHRDVTPHNVLISNDGEVKLGDFGIALARDRTRWTRPLFVKGKIGYMSPEQVRGGELDPRSDLFAVGVVLYELLAGERPWGRFRGMREARAIVESLPVPLVERRPSLAPALAATVERLILQQPGDRFASAEDVLRALAPFSAGELGSLRLATYARAALSNG